MCFLPSVFDFLLWYGKDSKNAKYRQLYAEKNPGEEGGRAYKYVIRNNSLVEIDPNTAKPGERLCTHGDCTSQGNEKSTYKLNGKAFTGGFKYKNPEGLDLLAIAGRLAWFGKTQSTVSSCAAAASPSSGRRS